MTGSYVDIAAADGGNFKVYVAKSAADKAPGLVLIQYICGVNAVMRGLADDFASKGYLVAVPDLFWRQEPGIELLNDPSKPNQEEQARALELNQGFDDEAAVSDLQSTITFLRGHENCSGQVGALGYCLGGRTAYLVAARTDADCSVGYYGVNIDHYLAEAGNISIPLMLHIAANDELCSVEAHDEIVGTLEKLSPVTLHEYEGAGHAFALVGGHNYNPVAAALANSRSEAFLALNIRQAGR
jgi:carboxymethylenebutenolidase